MLYLIPQEVIHADDSSDDKSLVFGYRCNSELSKTHDYYTVECKFDEKFSNDVNLVTRREDATMKCSKFSFEGTTHARVRNIILSFDTNK